MKARVCVKTEPLMQVYIPLVIPSYVGKKSLKEDDTLLYQSMTKNNLCNHSGYLQLIAGERELQISCYGICKKSDHSKVQIL